MWASPLAGSDPFTVCTGKDARCFDNVVAWFSVEPADDFTVLTVQVSAGKSR